VSWLVVLLEASVTCVGICLLFVQACVCCMLWGLRLIATSVLHAIDTVLLAHLALDLGIPGEPKNAQEP
jgi:hypothetical protein